MPWRIFTVFRPSITHMSCIKRVEWIELDFVEQMLSGVPTYIIYSMCLGSTQ